MRLKVRFSEDTTKLLEATLGRIGFISTFLPRKYKWLLVDTDQNAHVYVCLPESKPHRIGEIPLYYTLDNTPPPSCMNSLCIHSGLSYSFQQPNTVTRYLAGIPAIAIRCKRYKADQIRKAGKVNNGFASRRFALVITQENTRDGYAGFLQGLVGAGEVNFLRKGELPQYESYRFVVWLTKSESHDEEAMRLISAFDGGAIPVCLNPNNTSRYISENAFLSGKDVSHSKLIGRIKIINSNEQLFNRVASAVKLNLDLNASQLENFLDPFLTPDKIVCDFDKTETGWI